jgi:glycosyltransferase involved in cell wall biosynthesis
MRSTWHIITSEYPPQVGGVSDYTQLVARGLADAGDEVHVWCPTTADVASDGVDSAKTEPERVIVHRSCGTFSSADLHRVDSELDQFPAPRRLLVQWVPHGYGYRSINLQFCFWLKRRATKYRDVIELMVHEPYLPFGEGSFKQDGAAAVHRLMTAVLLRSATRVWMSIPAWEKRLRPYAFGGALEFNWLPIPSSIPVVEAPDRIQSLRTRYLPAGGNIVGHFGTYDRNSTNLLMQSAAPLLRSRQDCHLLLLGRGSEEMRAKLIAAWPEFVERTHATGMLPANDVSLHLSACDVLLQPYIDGVSSRRTSLMAGLSHGVPIVTTSGSLTESLWAESGAVVLVPAAAVASLATQTMQLLADEPARRRLSAAAKELYDRCFAIQRTIATLRTANY